jgi:hypothetical protein
MLRGRPSFIAFLAGGVVVRVFQEPPEVFALLAVSVFVGLPPGKARLRRRMGAASRAP